MVGSGRERYFHNHFAILRIEFLYWKFHKLFPIATKYIVIGCYEGEKNPQRKVSFIYGSTCAKNNSGIRGASTAWAFAHELNSAGS